MKKSRLEEVYEKCVRDPRLLALLATMTNFIAGSKIQSELLEKEIASLRLRIKNKSTGEWT